MRQDSTGYDVFVADGDGGRCVELTRRYSAPFSEHEEGTAVLSVCGWAPYVLGVF